MKQLKLLGMLSMLGLLAGCAPGMQMDENIRLHGTLNAQESNNSSDALLITPALVAQMNANHVNNPTYKVGVQDVLMIRVWGDAGLSVGGESKDGDKQAGGLVVQNNGTIFYPYVGNIKVEGESIEAVRMLLTKKLSKYIGKSSNELRLDLGKPDEDYKNEKGNFELVYKTKKYTIPCERRFEINSKSIVVGFVSNGCF